MSYGQLIWDVPKIEGIEQSDFPERKGNAEAVEGFLDLKTVSGEVGYIKRRAHVTINGTEQFVYGFTVPKGSNDPPFFNYNEAIENWGEPGSKDVFFVIAVEGEANEKDKMWNGYPYTRKKGDDLYYLFRLKKKPEYTGTRISWKDLKDCVFLVPNGTAAYNLWTKSR